MSTRPPTKAIFLAKRSYRQRRYRDLARMLPIAGVILLALPLLWPRGQGTPEAAATSSALIYLFAVWILLILSAAALARQLSRAGEETPEDGSDFGPGTD